MRKTIFISVLCFNSICYAQQQNTSIIPVPTQHQLNDDNWFDKVCSIGMSKGFGEYIGNNFIAKTYNANNPIVADLQFNIAENIGLGFNYKGSSSSLKTTQYVGTSVAGRFVDWGVYLCYYWMINKKWVMVPKIGTASFNLNNVINSSLDNSTYEYNTPGSLYFASVDMNYFFFKQVSIFANTGYSYIDLRNINASPATGTSYHKSNQIDIQLGIKVWLLKTR